MLICQILLFYNMKAQLMISFLSAIAKSSFSFIVHVRTHERQQHCESRNTYGFWQFMIILLAPHSQTNMKAQMLAVFFYFF